MVIGEFDWVELWMAVLVRVAEALGTPILEVSIYPTEQTRPRAHSHPRPSQT